MNGFIAIREEEEPLLSDWEETLAAWEQAIAAAFRSRERELKRARSSRPASSAYANTSKEA
jgi:hypothetical protein